MIARCGAVCLRSVHTLLHPYNGHVGLKPSEYAPPSSYLWFVELNIPVQAIRVTSTTIVGLSGLQHRHRSNKPCCLIPIPSRIQRTYQQLLTRRSHAAHGECPSRSIVFLLAYILKLFQGHVGLSISSALLRACAVIRYVLFVDRYG